MNMSFISQGGWAVAEKRLSARFGLDLYPAEERLMELLVEEVQQSDFSLDEILGEFEANSERIVEFGGRWYADCNKHDYGEEWSPEEGNQQEGMPPPETIGICQGFLVGYTLLFLYAKSKPEALLGFIRRRRVPHAKRVAKDVMRVFDANGADA
jgi:hypothetical protein